LSQQNHPSSSGPGGGHPFNRFSGNAHSSGSRNYPGAGGPSYGNAPGSSWSGARAGQQQGRRTYHSKAQSDYYDFLESDTEEGSEDEVHCAAASKGAVSHYVTLGISVAATEKEVKTAYRKLALQYHPDRNKDPGAEDKFKSIGEAYSVLVDKVRELVSYCGNMRLSNCGVRLCASVRLYGGSTT
jgi:hypothetical protein